MQESQICCPARFWFSPINSVRLFTILHAGVLVDIATQLISQNIALSRTEPQQIRNAPTSQDPALTFSLAHQTRPLTLASDKSYSEEPSNPPAQQKQGADSSHHRGPPLQGPAVLKCATRFASTSAKVALSGGGGGGRRHPATHPAKQNTVPHTVL